MIFIIADDAHVTATIAMNTTRSTPPPRDKPLSAKIGNTTQLLLFLLVVANKRTWGVRRGQNQATLPPAVTCYALACEFVVLSEIVACFVVSQRCLRCHERVIVIATVPQSLRLCVATPSGTIACNLSLAV